VQIVFLILSLAATITLPLIYFINRKRIESLPGFLLLFGAAVFLFIDIILVNKVSPGLADIVIASFRLILAALGLALLWFVGFRNMLRFLGGRFWLCMGGAIVLGFGLGLLSSGESPLDQLVAHSRLFGDYLLGALGTSPQGRIESAEVRVAFFVFLFGGILAGLGLAIGGRRRANRR
jgi:hypothetical protein